MPADARLSAVETKQFREVLETDLVLQAQAVAIANSMRPLNAVADDFLAQNTAVRASTRTLMSIEVLEEIHSSRSKEGERSPITTGRIIQGAVSVLTHTIERLAARRDHGVYPTIVEEILHEFYLGNVGQLGWSLMKKDAADAFKPDSSDYCGTAFLERLRAYWEAGNRPRILLVGHSAGCVFICNLLKHADALLPPEVKFDLVFLAPACTFELFAETYDLVWPRLGGLRLFTMRDELEIQDHLGLGYPRSILYFVSGVLEDERDQPIMGMQRFYYVDPPFDPGACPTVERVRKILRRPGRTIWSIEDAGAGRASSATTHNAFDDKDTATLQSVAYIISQGF
jgi:hypothetical protein